MNESILMIFLLNFPHGERIITKIMYEVALKFWLSDILDPKPRVISSMEKGRRMDSVLVVSQIKTIYRLIVDSILWTHMISPLAIIW